MKNLISLLLLTIIFSCSKETQSEPVLNDGQITLSLDLIREFSLQLDNSSSKSLQLEDSDFTHVYDNEIRVNFTSVPPGYSESLTFNPSDNSQSITLPYGEYNWEIPSEDNPSPISNTLSVSGQSTSVITINEPTVDLTLNVNTDYALVTVNDDYTSNVTLTHEDLSISMNLKDGYNYAYVLSGSTSTTLDLIDTNGDSYSSDIGLVESCKHYKYQLDYSEVGVSSLICVCEPFEVIERFIVPSQSNVFCDESDLPTSLRNGLLGMWTFCGDADDNGSLSNNGTVYGPLNEQGKFDQENTSFNFDGTDDYISLNDPFFNGDSSVSLFTFYTLFKVDELGTTSSDQNFLFTKEGYWRSISLRANNDQTITFGGTNPSPQTYFGITSISNYELDTWYNVVITFNSGELKLYINGVLDNTEAIIYSSLDWSYLAQGNSTDTTHIGNQLANAGPKNHFDGKIDDLMYWDRVLSDEEINLLNR
tara:strand:+ start:132 stop:1565 length:1434 start_codon:yes stop_codon:yes gene_type:complete